VRTFYTPVKAARFAGPLAPPDHGPGQGPPPGA